jgi:hypothetical protein
MGWFEDRNGRTLGDAPLDELRKCLLCIGQSYRDAVRRPPTMEEVVETLVNVLNGLDDTTVTGLSSLLVTDIRVKTKKRPKKGSWETGDLFAAKLPDGTYAFGRILWRKPPHSNTLVEFFRCRSTRPRLTVSVASLERLLPPMSISGVSLFEKLRWLVLDHEPGFRAPDHDQLRQYAGVPGKWQIFDAEFNTVARDVPEIPPGATDKNRFTFSQPEVVEAFLLERLQAEGVESED